MPIDCDSDPIGSLSRMFINMTMGPRILAGQCPVHRAVFLKPHGVAWGTFFIAPDLPADLRVGVFAGGEYPCWVRFSSDTLPLVPDLCTTMGLAIKLFDIPGKKLLPGEEAGLTQDFLLQFIERFFVPNATEMCRFTRAGVVEHNYDSYIDAHPVTKTVLAEMGKRVPSVFATPYWSVLPYALGPAQHVKYRVDAETTAYTGALSSATQPNFLHDDLKARLLAGEVRMNFAVQPRTDPEGMPLDDATVIWSEAASPPVRVATLVLARQDIDAPGQPQYGENLAFNPWHALPEHSPMGSLGEARKAVYKASADLRRHFNGLPAEEPDRPRVADAPTNVIPLPQCTDSDKRSGGDATR